MESKHPSCNFHLRLLGEAKVCRIYARSMLNWVLPEIKLCSKPCPCTVSVEDNTIFIRKNQTPDDEKEETKSLEIKSQKANDDVVDHPLMTHDEGAISTEVPIELEEGNAEADEDQCCSMQCQQVLEILLQVESNNVYNVGMLVNQKSNMPLVFYAFSAQSNTSVVKEFHDFMLKLTTANGARPNSCSSLNTASRNVKLEDLDSIRFEIMHLGKLQLQSDRLSTSFVDDAVDKFDWLHKKHLASRNNDNGNGSLDNSTTTGNSDANDSTLKFQEHLGGGGLHRAKQTSVSACGLLLLDVTADDDVVRKRCNSHDIGMSKSRDIMSGNSDHHEERRPRVRHRSECRGGVAAQLSNSVERILGFDRNKTGLLQVGKNSVTFISLDSTRRNLEISFQSMVSVQKGIHHPYCFGVFLKEIIPSTQQQHPNNSNISSNSNNTSAPQLAGAAATTDNITGQHQLHGRGENGFRIFCHLLKCVDQSTCEEILQALKQSRSNCRQDSTDPITKYHQLCKQMAQIHADHLHHSARVNEKSLNLAARFVADYFKPQEQRRVKAEIEEMQRTYRPSNKHEQLVIVMGSLRRWFEHRQIEHEERIKQKVRTSPTFMAKQFSFLRSRAKRSLNSFESLLGKGMAKMHEFQLETSSPVNSPVELASPHDKFKFFVEQQQQQQQSAAAYTQCSGELLNKNVRKVVANNNTTTGNDATAQLSSQRPRSNTCESSSSPGKNNSVTFLSPDMAGNCGDEYTSSNSHSNSVSPIRSSYSSPFFNTLPQTIAEEDENSIMSSSRATESSSAQQQQQAGTTDSLLPSSNVLTSVRASFSKLLGNMQGGKETNQDHVQVAPRKNNNNAVEETRNNNEKTDDDDSDDDGLFFTVKPPSQAPHNSMQLSPPRLKISKSESDLGEGNAARHRQRYGDHDSPATSRGNSSERSPPLSSSPLYFHQTAVQKASDMEQLRFYRRIYYKVSSARTSKQLYSTDGIFDDSTRSSPMTSQSIRVMWKRAIRDQVLINRIDNMPASRENSVDDEEDGNVKLNYPEIEHFYPEMAEIWAELRERGHDDVIETKVLKVATARGVSKSSRLTTWLLIARQRRLRHPAVMTSSPELYDGAALDELLKRLTINQHAILIDIGRTFPKHPYFSRQLGRGQLELFKILKAYSLVDRSLGYCQGLSFVAGLVLMHVTSTEEAFDLIQFLMIDLDFRSLYLPDMSKLHLCIYQLSRLLYDLHRDLYEHLQENEVTLLLFAAPWFLTMFASVLSFGFTVRIFDLIFLEGIDALFKAALCLLEHHKEAILESKGFEAICEYLKTELPRMDEKESNDVIRQMFTMELRDRLRTYEIEYSLLADSEEDDICKTQRQENLAQQLIHVRHLNRSLMNEKSEISDKLEAAYIKISSLQQALDSLLPDEETGSKDFDTSVGTMSMVS